MALAITTKFDPTDALMSAGIVRRQMRVKPKHVFFSQGQSANCIFYLESGRAKLVVVSKRGKEATVSLLTAGDFVGDDALGGVGGSRTSTASAVTACNAIKLSREEFLILLHQDAKFSDAFLRFMVVRAARTQEDLVDQLFNNSEKRLARTLLLMADFGKPGEPEPLIPDITQEALAHMIGTTRSRVSFFMNRFRRLGYITYNGRIHVHSELLNVVLQDRLPEQNATGPVILDHDPDSKFEKKKRAKAA
jgi:CRP/FNR family cyclic AMP-dependent transcriptional regulator